jgi:hypothetical protein
MRHWMFAAVLSGVAALAIGGLFTLDLFAGKPGDPGDNKKSSARGVDVAADTRSESASKLPVARVVLFNSGVGFFERTGEVEGDVRIDLAFPVQDINDMLKSMVVQDQNGGKVSAISFDSPAPVEKTLRSFAIDLSKNPSFAQILDQARGEKVEVVLQQSNTSQPGTMNGAIIGIERHQVPAGKDATTEVEQLNMWCAEGIRTVKLSDIQRMRFLNPVMESEFKKALEIVTQGHDTQKKSVSLNFTGQGNRTVRVGYVVENPIWKTSYRLVLDKEKAPFLQGWAVVENNSDEDWNGVKMSLVSGRPISFQMDLYQPLYVSRPVVEPELFASLRPPTYSGGMGFAGGEVGESKPALPSASDMPAAPTPPRPPSSAKTPFPGMVGLQGRIDLSQGVSSAASAVDLGDYFSYDIDHAITLGRQKSAMLPIVNQPIKADRVSIYSEKVQPKFPLLGLRLKNNTDLHLNQGPITVFDGNTYAGDARILDLQPKEERLVSYAVDLGTEVVPLAASDNGKRTSVKIVKGIIHSASKTRETKTYTLTNRSEQDRTVLIEHPFRPEFHLVSSDKPIETASDVYRFEVKVEKGKTVKQVVTEERDDNEQISVSNANDDVIRLLINDPVASKEIKESLRKALAMKSELDRTLQEVQNTQREIDRIKTDQPRLRENLKTIPQSDPLAKKLLQKLNDQESEIEKYEGQIKAANARADQQRKDFEAYLAGLNLQ